MNSNDETLDYSMDYKYLRDKTISYLEYYNNSNNENIINVDNVSCSTSPASTVDVPAKKRIHFLNSKIFLTLS